MIHHPYAPLGALLAGCVLLLLAACGVRPAPSGPYPDFAEYEGREVREVDLVGNLVLPEDTLRAVLITRGPECGLFFLPVCPFGLFEDSYRLDREALARDVVRLQLAYRDAGYYGTRVLPAVDPVGDDELRVRFAIDPGDRVVLRDLVVGGTEGIIPAEQLRDRLPLEVGGPFGRSDFLASADTVQAALLRRGYAYAEVLRNYSLDTIADLAEAEFEAVPGPLVTVDSVLILGGERLGEKTARRQLTFREGDVLRASELARSQRNLFDLGLVSFAAVEVAPDSLQQDSALASATVAVRLVEAPQYLVEASAGYGTVDCLRAGLRRTDRNFLGGARRLELSASTSKIGVGYPARFGLENSVCPALDRRGVVDRFSDTANYRLGAEFEQPDLFGTRTSALASAYVERTSEAFTYLRQGVGGQFALAREVVPQTLVTTTLQVERGRTDADDIVFCFTLDQCTMAEIAPLRERRWSNSLGVAAVRDQVRLRTAVPVGGYGVRAGVEWASSALGSDDRYLRLLAEGTVFREVRPGWTLGARLLGGTFLNGQIGDPDEYIPPERRFYAGGPNSVRGFEQNALGPGAYVQDLAMVDADSLASTADTVGLIRREEDPRRSAFGGTRTALASVELQVPSPILPQFFRFAGFVDAGYLAAARAEEDSVGALRIPVSGERVRVTPGVGIRFATPIGPIRLDAAYNPYRQLPGPLYVFDSGQTGSDLRLLDPAFRPAEKNGLFDRIQLHIAVGQAF